MTRGALFIDCGDVLFDDRRADPQWDRLAGQYFSSQFGGDPAEWIRANSEAFGLYIEQYKSEAWGHPEMDYNAFQERELPLLLVRMFDRMSKDPPAPEARLQTLVTANTWINERLDAATPGAPEAVLRLDKLGYRLHTCSGMRSSTVRARLKAMGIAALFGRHYGPDLVNCPKEGPLFFQKLFADSGEDPSHSIVIDDKSFVFHWAAEAGATCIRIGSADRDSSDYPVLAKFSDLPEFLGHPEPPIQSN